MKQPEPNPQQRIVVYTRRECCLCETALTQLTEFAREFPLAVETIDIDADSAAVELRARYNACVPVIFVNGRERFRGRINPLLLRRLLVAETRATTSIWTDSENHHWSWRLVRRILKNVLGAGLLIIGILLSVPGIPGPGFVFFFGGLAIIDWPGKHRFFRWLKQFGPVRKADDWLFHKFGHRFPE